MFELLERVEQVYNTLDALVKLAPDDLAEEAGDEEDGAAVDAQG